MTKIEELARIIAAAVTGLDPDTRFAPGEPARMNGIYGYAAPPEDFIRPIWLQFHHAAQSAIEAGFDRPDPPAAEPGEEVVEAAPRIGDTRYNGSLNIVEVFGENGWESRDAPMSQADWRDGMGLR